MAEIMHHVRALADEIGPRPTTTDAERRAASYLESVFAARGLSPEVQEFDSVRTYAWAYVLYNVLTLLSAWAAGFKPFLVWPAFALAAIVAFFMWSDLDTRWGLTRLMPKGPSQNVIARHVPKTRRGDRVRKIIVVAHYDSARSSLAFAPGMVAGFPVTFTLMKFCTFAVPVMVFAMALPVTASLRPWLWYATMGVSAYLIVPVLINMHREFMMPFVPGANDNASGVAAMLGVMERIVGEPDSSTFATSNFAPIRHSEHAAREAGVVPAGAELRYSSRPTELPDDFKWAEPSAETKRSQGVLNFETVEFAAVGGQVEPVADEPVAHVPDETEIEAPARSVESSDAPKHRRGFLGGFGGKKKARKDEPADVKGWLGVDDGFDARKEGANIGSWDNFGNEPESDDDGFGWKGGWAGDDPIGDNEFAAEEAARIRRRVTETVDRDLTEKEVWFVATGAEEAGTIGMQAFLAQYGEDVHDAMIINLDNVGAGDLYWITAEGMSRRYRADRRLISLVKRVSREHDIRIKPREFKGLSTDATAALARGYRALGIMALDAGGLPVNWHWSSDSSDALDPELIERTADLVTAVIREA
jgi:hypothetical protein